MGAGSRGGLIVVIQVYIDIYVYHLHQVPVGVLHDRVDIHGYGVHRGNIHRVTCTPTGPPQGHPV
jgi:hypothetical protein